MERFCAGDEGAFDELFDRHGRGVQGFVRKMVPDAATAEDLVQATFLSVIRARDRFDRRRSTFAAWLLTIAGNAARDVARHHRLGVVTLATGDRPVEAAYEAPLGDPKLRAAIERAFLELPTSQREAVLLHKVHGWSFDEIARSQDITTTAARIRAHRGYERLRVLLAAFEPS